MRDMLQVDFEIKFNSLKKKHPAHDIIPVIEELGNCPLSLIYIDLAMADEVQKPDQQQQGRELYKLKDKLYSQRAVLSNKFHDCKTDKERAEISYAIGSIQSQIVELRMAIEAFERTGEVPKATSRKMLPLDGRRKEKKLHSVRSSISRFRKLMSVERDQEKIKHYEQRIAELEGIARELAS